MCGTNVRDNRTANGQSRVRADSITGWRARDTTRRAPRDYNIYAAHTLPNAFGRVQ